MATRFQYRRTLLLALLLALIAAATLCVWGAAAAGYTFSSPALQAFIDAITGRGGEDLVQVGNGANGPPHLTKLCRGTETRMVMATGTALGMAMALEMAGREIVGTVYLV